MDATLTKPDSPALFSPADGYTTLVVAPAEVELATSLTTSTG